MSRVLNKRRTVTAIGLAVVTVAVSIATSVSPAFSAPDAEIRMAGAAETFPGHYTVVLKDTPSLAKSGVAVRAQTLTQKHRGTVTAVYEKAFTGFSVAMSEDEAKQLAADPSVDFVEQALKIHAADTQDSPPQWGLDRIDQRALPLDAAYSYDAGPQPATVYVLDTGVRITHTEFGGRASNGWDFISGDAVAEDCNGHGTHVAGTVAGKTYGVAKNVRVVAVRVLNCAGGATPTSIPQGIEWVIAHAARPAVINLSSEWICRTAAGQPAPCDVEDGVAVRMALQNAISAGIHVVVAAGNKDTTACSSIMAQVGGSIVVGASRANDAKPTYSNWGPCVDMWAPGGDDPPVAGCVPAGTPGYAGITSAGIASDIATCQISGTSMAAPHVAGAVALILARSGWINKTPAEVKAQLLAETTLNALTGINAGSPNKLLYNQPPPPGAGSSIALARHQNGLLELFGVSSAGTLFRRTQNGVNTTSWQPSAASINANMYSVCAQTDNVPAIALYGLHHARTAWHRRQLAANANSWSTWQSLDKNLTSCGAALNSAGRLELFGADSQGKIFGTKQTTSGGATYAPSTDISFGQVVRAVAAERNANNQVEVFALTRTGEIRHCWQTASPCGPGTWLPLSGQVLTSIAVARNANGTLAVFGVNSAGQLVQRNAAPGTDAWNNWTQPPLPASVGVPRSVAAEANADGRIALITVNTAGQVWQSQQTSVNGSTFGPWTQIDGLLRP